jgi:hypothetical protein
MKKREISPRPETRNREDGQGRGLGGDDGEQDGPGRKISRAQEIV